MAKEDDQITLVCFVKLEAPAGDVLLCDGGFVEFGAEKYSAHDAVFGSIHTPDEVEAAFGDYAESGTIALAPDPDAELADWFRNDLENCRFRAWMGEVGSDGKTISGEKLLADWLVDVVGREQSPGGEDLLVLDLIGRTEKLFLINEGNVCSERFHKSVWPGEDGFNNCVDTGLEVAWGIGSTPRGVVSTGSGGGGFTGGGFSLRMVQL